MNRRTIILTGASAVGSGSLIYAGLLGAGVAQRCPSDVSLGMDLLELRAVTQLGLYYLQRVASPGEVAELEALHHGLTLRPSTAGAFVRAAAAEMAAAAGRDFNDGNVIDYDGWVLARSEARACALIALSAPDPANLAV